MPGVSLFLPAKNGNASNGNANYWSATTDGDEQAKYVKLNGNSNGNFNCNPNSNDRTKWYLVRLVLSTYW